MKEITVKEMQSLELEMMSFIHHFCMMYGIRYYLIGGTLLGAIRHKSFIPWDDDIDITMPRDDYEKFISLFCSESTGNYAVLNIDTNDSVVHAFTKIIDTRTIVIEKGGNSVQSGVWIDIFPMDKMSDNFENAKKLFNDVYFYRKVLGAKLSPVHFSKSVSVTLKHIILKLAYLMCSTKWIVKRINQTAKRYFNLKSSKYICMVVMGTYGVKEILESESFSNYSLVDFEGYKFCAPCGYHEVLTHLYGDYMQLPPIEKRVSHHNFNAYWKEKI